MYKVEVNSKKGEPFKVKSKDYEFDIDIQGRGVTPPDALLASLASCVGVYLRKYAEGSKLELGEFDVKAEADLGSQAPYCFRQIKVSIDLKGVKLDERRQNALLMFINNCPVHNTLKCQPLVEVKIT